VLEVVLMMRHRSESCPTAPCTRVALSPRRDFAESGPVSEFHSTSPGQRKVLFLKVRAVRGPEIPILGYGGFTHESCS